LLGTPYGTISSEVKNDALLKKGGKMKLIKPDTYKTKYNYYATERGEIFSEISNRFLIPFLDKDGYQRVGLTIEGGRRSAPVHRLVMMAFYPREDSSSLQVNHIDSNRTNNNLENLEWVTAKENVIHSIDFGARKNKGKRIFSQSIRKEIFLKL
jgi:hypothetical protein